MVSPIPLPSIAARIATEIGCKSSQVDAAVALLDEGSTVPFIARYRKEATGGLDDIQLRALDERLGYLRELEQRRAAILESIRTQGKMTPELEAGIVGAETKKRLEDLYAPYKQKRRTKAQIALEAGLGALAEALLTNPELDPEAEAAKFLRPEFETDNAKNPGVADTKAALDGARQVLMERFAEDAELVGSLRTHLQDYGVVIAKVTEGKEEAGAKFRDYFDYSEPYSRVAPHRVLALLRGSNEEFLRISIKLPEDLANAEALVKQANECELRIAGRNRIAVRGRKADAWLMQTARWTWSVKLAWQLEMELFGTLREKAEAEAIRVFATNLHDLLLAAPAGHRVTMGLDPGLRTGVKVAVVDRTGKLVDTATIYPHVPRNDWEGSLHTLGMLAKKHGAELISIGNGTASRETDKLAVELIKRHADLQMTKLVVSEAGASVYSASELASREFPQLDVSLRGAVSIARRLQDPLAELVKIDPKSIGVGQYQHDVSQTKLARQLDAVVEDCVNAVGVDVNTASVPLLARISGLSTTLAKNIVNYRDTNGPFKTRAALKEVSRLGPKTFEQAAGFLRVPAGDNPLDASSVHPEAYPVVERILADLQRPMMDVMRDASLLKAVNAAKYTDERFGLPTVRDILKELEKPGRDPRPEFKTATFREGIEELSQLEVGMVLEGVVTNVTNFGAFVDVGVHQDGLVHISVMSNKFVKDPHEVVKAGEIVKVKVMEVDGKRRRIALSMRLDEAVGRKDGPSTVGGGQREVLGNNGPSSGNQTQRDGPGRDQRGGGHAGRTGQGAPGRDQRHEERPGGAMADALRQLLKR